MTRPMSHKTLIAMTVGVVIGATIIVAYQLGWGGFWFLLVALVPVGMLNSMVFPLIVTGVVAVLFIVFGVLAWRRKSSVFTLTFCCLFLMTGAIANIHAFFVYRYVYPYGWSHCCNKAIGFALLRYADDHEGHFPSGGATPEASLSLLLTNYCDLYILRGKTVPLKVAQAAWERNKSLTPDSCGWHYVEGLTKWDDPELAILWDKVPGLNHNAGRASSGGSEVLFLDGHTSWIPGSQWPDFLTRQQTLMTARPEAAKKGAPCLTAKIRLPDGQFVDHYNSPYEIQHGGTTDSGKSLEVSALKWCPVDCSNCTYSYTLSFAGMRSKPAEIVVSNWMVSPNPITFEMETVK